MLQPGSSGVGEEHGEVADDEVVIVHSTQLASQPVVREPQFRPCLPRVLGDGSRVFRVRPVWTEASRMNREVEARCSGGTPAFGRQSFRPVGPRHLLGDS
jgi:hypothetical protein